MAEPISEGTLEQFSKDIGEYVEANEGIVAIETDNARTSYSYLAALRLKIPF